MVALVDVLDLARFQFAMTTIFHYFFVPMSIGLAVIVSTMETLYVIKKDKIYLEMTKFWAKMLILSFAVGVVTGIIQEFQFGMNWSDYSRFVGDIFGAPLAIEALVAFFAESTFLGFWSFTWGKVKPWMHAMFIWIVTFGSFMSAMWILVANSFMHNPVGYALNSENGRAELNDFFALLKNPQFLVEFPHVMFGTLLTGAFVVMGMSAFKLLKVKAEDANSDRMVRFFRKSITIGAVWALIGAAGSVATGDLHALQLKQMQPMKFAAMEGISETIDSKDREDGALPWAVIAFTDPKTHDVVFEVEVPYALSILSEHSLTGGKVTGTHDVNEQLKEEYATSHPQIKDFYVPENTLFYAFRVMAMGAGALAGVAVLALFFNRKSSTQILRYRWWLWIMGVFTFAPFVINTAGWLVLELGRYPWVVYGLFTIADAVSPNVSVASMLTSNILYFLTFAALGTVMIVLMRRTLHKGPDFGDGDKSEVTPQDPMATLQEKEN
jgi:cytochrome d ubiquinol oxidase subunit I